MINIDFLGLSKTACSACNDIEGPQMFTWLALAKVVALFTCGEETQVIG